MLRLVVFDLEGTLVDGDVLFAGAADVVRTLWRRKDTVLAVATGNSRRIAERVLEAHGLGACFSSLQTPDANRSKPDPEMLFAAMDVAGVGPRATVMVGDTVPDMVMARTAGVRALGVGWGYHGRAALLERGAENVVANMGQLVGAIDRLLEDDDA